MASSLRITGWLPVVVVLFGTDQARGERHFPPVPISSTSTRLPVNLVHPKISQINTHDTIDRSLIAASSEGEREDRRRNTLFLPASSPSYKAKVALARRAGLILGPNSPLPTRQTNPVAHLEPSSQSNPPLVNSRNFCYGNCAVTSDDPESKKLQKFYVPHRKQNVMTTSSDDYYFPVGERSSADVIPSVARRSASRFVLKSQLKYKTSSKHKGNSRLSKPGDFDENDGISNRSNVQAVDGLLPYNFNRGSSIHSATKKSRFWRSRYADKFSTSQNFEHHQPTMDSFLEDTWPKIRSPEEHETQDKSFVNGFSANDSEHLVVGRSKSKRLRRPTSIQAHNANSERETFNPIRYRRRNRKRKRSGIRRKRFYNNIAEIIDAENERDFQNTRITPNERKNNISPEENYHYHYHEADHVPHEMLTSTEEVNGTKRFIRNDEYNDKRPQQALSGYDAIRQLSRSRSKKFLPGRSSHSKISNFVNRKFINFGNTHQLTYSNMASPNPPKAYVHHPLTHSQKVERGPLHRPAETLYRSSVPDPQQKPAEQLDHQPSLSSTYASQHSYGHEKRLHESDYDDGSYQFGYNVKSPYHGTRFQHKEQKKGKSVSGEYRVHLPDGRVQIVRYTADDRGYRPTVTYVRPGGGYPAMVSSARDYPISRSEFHSFH